MASYPSLTWTCYRTGRFIKGKCSEEKEEEEEEMEIEATETLVGTRVTEQTSGTSRMFVNDNDH